MPTVHLKMKDVLLKCREVFDAGGLQRQQEGFEPDQGCFYTGPCAIGASVPYHIAHEWDNADSWSASASFDMLVMENLVSVDNEEEWEDMSRLQRGHDEAMTDEDFNRTLEDLENKYGLRNVA